MNIAVTGLNATDNPGPGVPVIRCLREQDEFTPRLIGLNYDALEPGIYMDDIASANYFIPYPSNGLENLFERLMYIHSKEKLDIIIPTLDSELYGFIKLQDRLRAQGIETYLPRIDSLNWRGKDKLFDFCKANDISFPKNEVVTNEKDLRQKAKELGYPVVVKGIFYEAYISHNEEELEGHYRKLVNKWGFPIILQEYIKGDEFNVCALGDGEGETVGAVAMRKLYITDKGKGWAGVTISDEELLSLTHKTIRKMKWRSGMELEFMKSKKDGKFYLLEINPRFPAWVYLTKAAGLNLPHLMVKLIKGEKFTYPQEFEIGKMFVRCSWDLITDMKQFENITVNGEMTNND